MTTIKERKFEGNDDRNFIGQSIFSKYQVNFKKEIEEIWKITTWILTAKETIYSGDGMDDNCKLLYLSRKSKKRLRVRWIM